MTERKLLIIAVFAAGAAVPGIPALAFLWSVGAAKPLFAMIGVVIAAFAIGVAVRFVNRLGDPHCDKLPSDAP
jgi:hypothetical protein